MTLLELTLKSMLESKDETIRRNAMSIYKTMTKQGYKINPPQL